MHVTQDKFSRIMAGRVLIIDDQAANRIGMKARLASAAYETLPASDGYTALSLARSSLPDAVLVDLDLRGPLGGIDVLRALRAEGRMGQVPMIGIGTAGDSEQRIAALDAGADDVLTKPVEAAALLARLRNLMRRPELVGELASSYGAVGMAEPVPGFQHRGLIAVVADRADAAVRLRNDLAPLVAHRTVTMTRTAALADVGVQVPDIFLLEGDPEGPAGTLSLMAELRSRSAAQHAAFCLLRPAVAAGMDAVAFDMGAQDVAAAGGDLRELALRLGAVMRRKAAVDAHRSLVQEQLRLAVRDPLTGLHNRRYALHHLAGIAEAARMEGESYAVMVLDLDRFKQVNDRLGHAAGDAVLVGVGDRLLANIRAGDLLARHGGEEFLIALPGTGLAEATAVAERLCMAVQEGGFALPSEVQVSVTASVGLAMGGGDVPVRDVIDRADRALFAAKEGGRNRVRIDSAA